MLWKKELGRAFVFLGKYPNDTEGQDFDQSYSKWYFNGSKNMYYEIREDIKVINQNAVISEKLKNEVKDPQEDDGWQFFWSLKAGSEQNGYMRREGFRRDKNSGNQIIQQIVWIWNKNFYSDLSKVNQQAISDKEIIYRKRSASQMENSSLDTVCQYLQQLDQKINQLNDKIDQIGQKIFQEDIGLPMPPVNGMSEVRLSGR